ncbi:hypothetical protein CPAR01_12726 [Colletotrichum paranaense]|uniref:Uncharacterized protein n=1 Tax=Colletotrichum paranaense TaxID=1914294 RepID=A0ABQ9S7A3_9PEZI|nr:uncharacterized protein CPAR01_12726 [Colletotrichum paranaense]KAK1528168.1 hypothetical protein CPAR01_12726 [Colletotrichum paranaense]
MAALASAIPTPPMRDQILIDKQELTVGNVTFMSILTPGHSPGNLSLVFPVFEQGVPHIAGLNGGTGIPAPKVDREKKIVSQNHLGNVVKMKGVDTLISSHQIANHALFQADLLSHRQPDAANPFVVGIDDVQNYMRFNALYTNVKAARQGMDLDV